MSEPTFDTETTALHQTARFILIPWLARFFGNGPLRGDSGTLPVGNARALTDETVLAIEEITNRVAWKFLARECGWPKLDALDPQNSENHSIRRLWEEPEALPPLKFSTATPDLLIGIFNETRRDHPKSKLEWPDCTRHNGDLLVHHLVFERIIERADTFEPGSQDWWNYWLRNPLNAFCVIPQYRNLPPRHTEWERLCDPDLAPFVPWIGDRFSKRWQGSLRENQIEGTLQWMETATFVMTDWGLQAEKSRRLDLLGMLLDFLAAHSAHAGTLLGEWERFTEDQPLHTRQETASPWVDFLALLDPLEESARKVLAIHPVERSGPQKCFLARWEALGFNEVAEQLREILGTLRPSFT